MMGLRPDAIRRRAGLASVLLAAGLFGCHSEPLPVTQVIVVVGGDPHIDELEVTVRSENGRNFSEARRIALDPTGSESRRLPTSFTIVPADQDRPEAQRFRLVVLGRSGSLQAQVPRVRSIAIAGFTAGKTTLLPLLLSAACENEVCGCPWTDDTCTQTCMPPPLQLVAACAEVPEYTRLAEVPAGDELEALARGAGGCKPGEMLEANGRCADLDECLFGVDTCDFEPRACENIVGGAFGYRCHCPLGFAGDGVGANGCEQH